MWIAVTREVSSALGNCELSHVPREAVDVARAGAQHRDYQRALDLYRNSAGWGDAATRIGLVETSLESVKTRLGQIELEQGDPAAAKTGKVAGAIIGLIDALRNKSTKKKDEEH